MKKIAIGLLLIVNLFAHRDAVIFGVGTFKGSGTSKENSRLSNTRDDYDIKTNSVVYKIGTHFNIDRRHLYKGKWVFVYEKKNIEFEKNSKKEEYGGYKTAMEYSWGRKLDVLLNDELIPFVKFGFGWGRQGHLDEFNEASYGVGVEFVAKYFELELGYNRKNREWGAWRSAFELFRENYNDKDEGYFFNLNFRFE